MFTALITTMDKYIDDHVTKAGIIDGTKMAGAIKEYQTVIAIGDSVRNVAVGELVCVDPKRFGVKKHKKGSLQDGVIEDNVVLGYEFDTIIINNKEHLLLQDRDISYVVEEYEESDKTEASVLTNSKLILPDVPKFKA
jgi:hypothetical protein